MNKRVYLFTYSFPYGTGETFLENELPYLCKAFDEVRIVPLCHLEKERDTPSNCQIEKSLLSNEPNNKKSLLKEGLFNFSPLFFAFKLFFQEKAYTSMDRCWSFFTALLTFRAAYSGLTIKLDKEDTCYFYWGDKSTLLIPYLKETCKKSLARFHGSDLYEYAKGGYIPFRRWLLPNIDQVFCISKHGKQYLKSHYKNYTPEEIEIAYLGVEDHGLNPHTAEKELYVLTCSNLIQLKRVHLLAKALQKVSLQVKWIHIGDGPEKERLFEQTKTLPKNIQFIHLGKKPNQEVLKFYQSQHIDLFINVSSSEGVPVSIMEALSFGIPVIATDVGGCAEMVDNKVGKLLSKDFNNKDLVEAIENPLIRSAITRHKARQRWEDKFQAKKNYTSFIEKII